MEYYPIDPGNYGITIDSTDRATPSNHVRRKRQRDEDSGHVSRYSEHDGSSSTSSAAVHTSSTTRQRTGEPTAVNCIGEATDTPSSSSKAASNSLSTPAASISSTAAPSISSTATPSISSTAAPTISSMAAAATPSTTESSNAKSLEKLAARKQQREERWKRNIRESIARQVGHEVDSDGERQYWQDCRDRDRAEEARRDALSPEARRQEDVQFSANILRAHIKPRLALDYSGLPHLEHYPLFVLQTAPESRNGAGCKLSECTKRIAPGQYRIALSPGDNGWGSPDYYHIKCFEELLDLSSPHYVARFQRDARKHIPDHGANCILEEYIARWKLRLLQPHKHGEERPSSSSERHVIAQSSNTDGQPSTANATEQHAPRAEVLAGSAAPEQVPATSSESPMETSAVSAAVDDPSPASSQTPAPDVWTVADRLWAYVRQAEAEASREHSRLVDDIDHANDADDVADASADKDQTWQITQYLPPETDPDYDERHALSQALGWWKFDVLLATSEIDELSEEGRQWKQELGELSIKRIKRYNVYRMPDYQSAFLRSW